MNYYDNADRWNGRRDEELIPDGHLDYIEISFAAAWIDDVCRNPVTYCRRQACNAQPFVQSIGFVQTAQPGLYTARTQRQYHRDTHGDHAHHA